MTRKNNNHISEQDVEVEIAHLKLQLGALTKASKNLLKGCKTWDNLRFGKGMPAETFDAIESMECVLKNISEGPGWHIKNLSDFQEAHAHILNSLPGGRLSTRFVKSDVILD